MRRSVACVWTALTHTLSLSPQITRCLNACSSARPPPAPGPARAVRDAVPSARCCPRPLLALSVTLSRARAAGLHPSFQPCSNRSPPCGRCRVAASSTVLLSYVLTRRSNILFERARPPLTHCSNACSSHWFERALARASACASLHIEVLPAAGAA